jgi:glycerol-3-phosphate dehydrogenase
LIVNIVARKMAGEGAKSRASVLSRRVEEHGVEMPITEQVVEVRHRGYSLSRLSRC